MRESLNRFLLFIEEFNKYILHLYNFNWSMVENLQSLPLLSIVCVGKHCTRWIFKIPSSTNILILSRKTCWSSLPIQKAKMAASAPGVLVSGSQGGNAQNRNWDGIPAFASCSSRHLPLVQAHTTFLGQGALCQYYVLPVTLNEIWTHCSVEVKQKAPIWEPCQNLPCGEPFLMPF